MKEPTEEKLEARRKIFDREGWGRLKPTHTIILSDRDRDIFLAELDNPSPPTPALVKAVETYRRITEVNNDPVVLPPEAQAVLRKALESGSTFARRKRHDVQR